jgi:hypothetical protein
MLKKKIVAIVVFAFISCGSIVLAGQNSNSSTTMQSNTNMGNMNMSGKRGRRKHRRHRRGRVPNKSTKSQ